METAPPSLPSSAGLSWATMNHERVTSHAVIPASNTKATTSSISRRSHFRMKDRGGGGMTLLSAGSVVTETDCSPSRKSSRLAALGHLVHLALAAAAERVILAQRMGWEVFPGENPPQVGVIPEADAEHVVHLALAPFRAGPDVGA